MKFHYVPEVLETLAGHGLAPDSSTPPSRVRDALRDLYRYEIRRLRQSFLRGDIPKPDYSRHVIDLRRQYWLLSVPVQHWTRREE
ncbi:MAG TPA: hypothetical protein VFZ98_03480 [Vicinamibacterales bacterium]